MPNDNDVNALFRRFGGDVSTYQEVMAEQQVEAAVGRWPILNQINPLVRRLNPASDASPSAMAASQAGVRQHRPVSEPSAAVAAVPTPPLTGSAQPVAARGAGGAASWLGSTNTATPTPTGQAPMSWQQGRAVPLPAEGGSGSAWAPPGRGGGQTQAAPPASHGDAQGRVAGVWGGMVPPPQAGHPGAGSPVRPSELSSAPKGGAQAGLKALFSRIVSQKTSTPSKAAGTSASVQGKW